jgi:Tol biopolymer transport system component
MRQGALVARTFDPSTGSLTGDPVVVANFVRTEGPALAGTAAFSVSAAGTVAYRAGAESRRLVWFDRAGRSLGTLGDADENGLSAPPLAPDGSRVVAIRTVQRNTDLWILDDTRTARFTFDREADQFPVWSPDGREIAFDSNRKDGVRNLYRKAATGAGDEELVFESAQNKAANSWSSDRRFLFFSTIDPKTQTDLWVLPMQGERSPYPFLATPADERSAMISPDGRWVAYLSNEAGRFQVYVRPFPPGAGQWQVSSAGGFEPRWRPDGRELYYVAPDARLMAVSIGVRGSTLEPGTPTPLFATRIAGGATNVGARQQYDVTRDGRFLVNTISDDVVSPITLLLNWAPLQK